jgi:hypothetical protein
LRLEGLSQWPFELNSQIGICPSDLDLLPPKENMILGECMLQCFENNDLGFAQINPKLLKVAKAGKVINLSLKSLERRSQKDQIVNKDKK